MYLVRQEKIGYYCPRKYKYECWCTPGIKKNTGQQRKTILVLIRQQMVYAEKHWYKQEKKVNTIK
jgi:hypothetical protein